ncbi:TetR/AcrR family transcriptional regulator [Pseudonocardia sp. RS11V-5]|uniref:TetR/AcrR family transcriptional regulator n=1 Tax=Pseudonocardia terrae TaxID=2905831 RepID=UPI001E49E8B8|nr:TetR/AcrR family transcriptional regulator [Pseudonocardia terrae]MCE3555885.1 TetR/AcrR family transcriptional regulator [Pseudonocardia terrae]
METSAASTPASSSSAPSPRRRVSRAERERQILDAAVTVFSERGYANASMDAVAERVGVTKPVLYTHFGSKEGLLLACVSRARTELLEVTSEAAFAAEGPEDMLRRGTLAFFRFLDDRAPAFTLLYSEASIAAEAVEAIRAQQTDFIAGLLGVAAPGADPLQLQGWAQVIVGACERLAVWRKRDPRVTAERATEYLMDLAWGGLAGRTDRSVDP